MNFLGWLLATLLWLVCVARVLWFVLYQLHRLPAVIYTPDGYRFPHIPMWRAKK